MSTQEVTSTPLKWDCWLQRSVVLLLSILQQTMLAGRAFSLASLPLQAVGIMAAACLFARARSLAKTAIDRPENHSSSNVLRRLWIPAGLFIGYLSLYVLPDYELPSRLNMARAVTLGMLAAQVMLVATCGFQRIELLVLAMIVQVLSLVCTTVPVTVPRQIVEAVVAISLFALLSDVVALDPRHLLVLGPRGKLRTMTLASLIGATVLIARPLTTAADGWVMNLQIQIDQALFESALETRMYSGKQQRYVDTASLNDVVQQYDADPRGIALRVFCNVTPGYLRGRAFDEYRGGQWRRYQSLNQPTARRRTIEPSTEVAPATLPSTSPQRNPAIARPKRAFVIRDSGSGESISVEVQNDPTRGQFFFLPMSASQLDGVGSRLVLDGHGTIIGGVDTKESYIATVRQNPGTVELPEDVREALLRLPDRMPAIIRQTAVQVGGLENGTRTKARRISEFFQRSFSYSTAYRQIVRSTDPIGNLLATRHPAHCEYFASATTLMLRSLGVPARYVTGYVVDEYSEDAGTWLGRNINAHAWVEAYDDETKRWFVVESTPGRSYQTFDFSNRVSEVSAVVDGEEVADEESFWDRFYWYQLLRQGRWSDLLIHLFELARWPLLITTSALLGIEAWRWRKTRSRTDARDAGFRKRLAMLDRQAKRAGIRRLRTDTLEQIAAKLEDVSRQVPAKQADNYRDIAEGYRRYSVIRYRSMPVEEL